MKVLANAVVAIILQYINVRDEHIVHLKFMMLNVNYSSIKLEK